LTDIDVPVALRAWAPSPGASGAFISLSPGVKYGLSKNSTCGTIGANLLKGK
jgi:hypothetical protein